MKTLFSKKYLVVFLLCLLVVVGLVYFLFFRKGPFERKVFLFEKESTSMLPGNLIFIGKNKIYIKEIITREEVLADAEGTERYDLVKELTPGESRMVETEYNNYRFDKAKGIIIADELEDVITVISPEELSYKGDVYKITFDISFSEDSERIVK